jgi:tripeptidyl-peptidase I
MRLLRFIFFYIFILGVIAQRGPYVVHEKCAGYKRSSQKKARLSSQNILPIRIALAQQNLHLAGDLLMSVSNPTSPQFSQYWTAKEVAQRFAPSRQAVGEVVSWLNQSGIVPTRLKRSHSGGWLSFNCTVQEAELLLHTKYHVYERGETGEIYAACEEYSVPMSIQKCIDFMMPTVPFHNPLERRQNADSRLRVRRASRYTKIKNADEVLESVSWTNATAPSLSNCDQYTTIDCLQALYNISSSETSNPDNSFGIVEFAWVSYLPENLDSFFNTFMPSLVGQRPKLESIDGGDLQSIAQNFVFNGEADLDLEYSMSLTYPLNVTNYQVGDMLNSGTMNNFLAALDQSYCGALDPEFDSIYPDLKPGGYNSSDCGIYKPTNVISVSYANDEVAYTAAYLQRECLEYLKLGLQGVTVIVSSADFGAAGHLGQCINPITGQVNNSSSGHFNPTFPSTCPYVTSVGGTQLPPNASVFGPETAFQHLSVDEIGTSGGGFSNVFHVPTYQSLAVQNYLNQQRSYLNNVTASFNSSGCSRGFPDVSANAANYITAVDGNFVTVYGTSASTPVFASIITKINDARLSVGKRPVGFINPVLYANQHVLNDVVSGSNYGCGAPGFKAAVGWDPVTGLGTPDYKRMLDLYMELP